ncbi:MAG: rhomboid family intramembrane serine protease [Bacteroidetes bacterium]|nr:rhomboid family intramembrane serine protease [Bacteroidota bacterium]
MFFSITPVVLNLLIINGLVWLLQLALMQTDPQYLQYFVLVKTDFMGIREALYHQVIPPGGFIMGGEGGGIHLQFQPYQLVTHFFSHSYDSVMHILFNMLALVMLGPQVERVIGSRRFLRVYLFAGFVGGIFVALFDPSLVPVLGASGAVSGIVLLFAMIYPDARMIIFPIPIPIKAKYLVTGVILLSLFMVIQSMQDPASGGGVSHFGHLMGMFATFLYIAGVRAYSQYKHRG